MAARLRFPLLALGIGSLFCGVWAGLLRFGWGLPAGRANLIGLHGPLMVFGFLGTVISLERAVALRRPWGYLAPLGTIAGAALLFIPRAAAHPCADGDGLRIGDWLDQQNRGRVHRRVSLPAPGAGRTMRARSQCGGVATGAGGRAPVCFDGSKTNFQSQYRVCPSTTLIDSAQLRE